MFLTAAMIIGGVSVPVTGYAEETEHHADLRKTNKNLQYDLEQAKQKQESSVRIDSDFPTIGTISIGSEFRKLYGTDQKQVSLGYVAAGKSELSKKTIPFTVEKTLQIELRGTLQSYLEGVKGGSGGADTVSSASTGGGGISSPDSEKNQLSLWIKEGDGEFVEIKEYQKAHPEEEIDVKLQVDKESGMEAKYVLHTVVLEGTPKKEGNYHVTATVTSKERTAISNKAEFRIYNPKVSLSDRFKDLPSRTKIRNMEPYYILNVGNTTVPKMLKQIARFIRLYRKYK